MAHQTKVARQDMIRKVIAGWVKYYGKKGQVVLAGQNFNTASLQKFLQADVVASDAADQAKAAWLKLAEAERTSRADTDPVLRAIQRLVLSNYGDAKDATDVLAVFGYSPRKPRKATGAEMVATAEKSKATRIARGTKSPNEKKQIYGVVTDTAAAASSTPAASSPATATPAAPPPAAAAPKA